MKYLDIVKATDDNGRLDRDAVRLMITNTNNGRTVSRFVDYRNVWLKADDTERYEAIKQHIDEYLDAEYDGAISEARTINFKFEVPHLGKGYKLYEK